MDRSILGVLTTCSVLGIVFLVSPGQIVSGQERYGAKIAALAADSQIASLLIKIETGLRDNQAASSAEMIDMLVSAASLMPDATPEGTRLMQNFPGRLIALADQESKTGELAKSNNLRVFADAAAPLVIDRHKMVPAQQQIAMAPANQDCARG